MTLKYTKNALAAGAEPAGEPPPHHPPPPRSLRRLDSRTFGARQSASPTVFFTNRTLITPTVAVA